MNGTQCDLSVVIPVYNEVEVIDGFYSTLTEVISRMGISYEVLFVDDGSDDGTFEKVSQISEHDAHVTLATRSTLGTLCTYYDT